MRAAALWQLLGAWVTRDLGARRGARRKGDVALVLFEIFAAADEFDRDADDDGSASPSRANGGEGKVEAAMANGNSGNNAMSSFNEGLSYAMFRERLERHGIALGDDDFATLVRFVDKDGNGMIDHTEFTAHFKH